MTNPAPITLRQLFRYYKGEPHQVAAVEQLEEAFRQPGASYASVMRRDRDWFHTWSQAGKQPEPTRILEVPYFAQLDSATDQGRRMCFSSSCAMLLATLRPGLIRGANADDQYLARVRQFGDTTSPLAQTRALESFGLPAEFTKRADFKALERSIASGVPVPVGYLHRGPVEAPAGGGHWAIVIGLEGENLVVHDPFGEADLISGATLNRTGKAVRYSRKNFARRWMVEGPGTGWAVLAKR
jgi:hypothetical protein